MKNKGLMFLGLILSLPLLWTQIIWAADLIPASPTKVILQMKGGVLEVEEEVLVKTVDGKSTCQILLPNGAQNVRLLVPEHTILSWSQKSFRFKRTNLATENREKLESQLQEIDIALKLLSQREQLWNVTTNAFTYEDILKIDKQKMEILPSLLKEEKALNKKKQKLLDELKQFKEIESMGSLVTITLADEVQSPKVKVQYNYFLQNCGWRPHYTFAIDPEQGKNEVKVRFLADVWQSSGIDWKNSKIVLMTGTQGQREPPRVNNWVIVAQEPSRSKYEDNYRVMEDGAMPMRESYQAKRAPSHAEPAADTQGIFATWTLDKHTLNEGRLEMLIHEQLLSAPITWIARPNRSQGEVYLMAKAALPSDQVWPQGSAVYMVQGQATGTGVFKTEGGEVVLYFGRDPRVSLEVSQDSTKRGESGFLGRDKTWTWAWTYTLKNSHKRAIKVRVERPEPQIVDENISVTYQDKPKAQVDKAKHVLFWELDLPPQGQVSLQHGLTLKAPEKMILYPVAP